MLQPEAPEPTQAFIRPVHWLLPFAVLLLTAPFWLGLFEPHLFYALNRRFSILPDGLWAALSMLGTGWCIYAMASPLILKHPAVFVSWLCAAPFAGVFTRLGKMWANNPRPLEVLDAQLIHVIGEPLFIAAMPSGHSMTSFAAASAIYFSLSPNHRLRHLWLFALAIAAALSRIAVGAHWPADVSVGAAAGIFSGLIGATLARKIPFKHLQPRSWLMRALVALGFYSFYVLITDEMGFAQNMPLHYLLAALLAASLLLFVRLSLLRASPTETGR